MAQFTQPTLDHLSTFKKNIFTKSYIYGSFHCSLLQSPASMDKPSEIKTTLSPPQPPSPVDIDASEKTKLLGGVEWIDKAMIGPRTILEFAISNTKSCLNQIKSTSSARIHSTLNSLHNLKSKQNVYEDILVAKIKESVYFAAAHPFAISGVVVGSGFLVVKRTRRALYYTTLHLFISDEAMLSRATPKVQKLRDSFKDIIDEGKKLEKLSLDAEAEFTRGRKKLRQAGKQIQGVVNLAYRIERQSGGLKDVLKELPKMDALQFRSEVLELASKVKEERRVLKEAIMKISNYGIPV